MRRKKVVLDQPDSFNIHPDVILDILERKISPIYENEVSPKDGWVLPNRVKFTSWIDHTFKYAPKKQLKQITHDCKSKEDIELFSFQKFVRDYIQFASPYRGIILYHGLGSGKSASSIAAGEILMNHMDVTVMLPASLENNYINEVKRYGMEMFCLDQHWVFVSEETLKPHRIKIKQLLSLDKNDIIKKNKGLWIPIPGKNANFNQLQKEFQEQIENQINTIIQNKYNFIHYNGLTRNSEILSPRIENPFNNKCVIIDEAHNLVSRIVNKRLIGLRIYKLLMEAHNCKLILLSGTPIINNPFEIAYMINLVTGYKKEYIIKLNKNSNLDTQDIERIEKTLSDNKYIDYVEFDRNSLEKQIHITFLPEGFYFNSRPKLTLLREHDTYAESNKEGTIKSHEYLRNQVVKSLQKMGVNVNKTKHVPILSKSLVEKEEEFNEYFISGDSIINENLFIKRILGTVSYWNKKDVENFPTVKEHIEKLPLSSEQFSIYIRSRAEERKLESRSKDGSSSQVYRTYSRANCNFVFPDTIKRPLPKNLQALAQLDKVDDNEQDDKASNSGNISTSRQVKDAYFNELKKALRDLSTNNHLKLSSLGKYSPKFKEIVTKIKNKNGKHLIYSQFKTVEGLRIISDALAFEGYSELLVQKNENDEWDINLDTEDDINKKYIIFSGSTPENNMLLKIFNCNGKQNSPFYFEDLPKLIKEKLRKYNKGDGNVFGDLINIIMITQSGSEGISLKAVRYVHIVEPYWNYIRMDQVVGRAVRHKSHDDLPLEMRKVDVYYYISTFTEEQLKENFTLRTQDDGKTSDEYIFNSAMRKKTICDQFLNLLKKASIDCALNNQLYKKDDKPFKCFNFPANIDQSELSHLHDIYNESLDEYYNQNIKVKSFVGHIYITKKGNFIIRDGTDQVYDYDMYLYTNKLVKIGKLVRANGTMRVIRDE